MKKVQLIAREEQVWTGLHPLDYTKVDSTCGCGVTWTSFILGQCNFECVFRFFAQGGQDVSYA